MEMETLEWRRRRARIVAIVDLVLSCLGLLLLVVIMMDAPIHWDTPSANKQWDLWILLAFLGIVVFIQFYAVLKLFQGTQKGREYNNARKNCATYRNITVVFLVLQIGGNLLAGHVLNGLIAFVIRGMFVVIVGNFIVELDKRRTPLEVPNMVTVTLPEP